MGGSLALALRRARPDGGDGADAFPAGAALRLIGVDRDASTRAAALAAGAIDVAEDDLAAAVAAADAVVLAVPVRGILALLPRVGAQARPGPLILDLGSSKTVICAAMAALPAAVEPIGGHPMAGSEHIGFAGAQAELFTGRPFVLCPLARTSPAALAGAEGLARATGARPLLASPEAHDRAVAAISHLPYVAAAALVRAVEQATDPLAWTLASSGFRDTTRVAAGSVDVMLDALLTNHEAVLSHLDILVSGLDRLRTALASGDEVVLRAELTAAQRRRAAL